MPHAIYIIGAAGGEERRTSSKNSLAGYPSLVLSPDGRFAAAVQLDQSVNDLMIIGNFR